MISNSAALTDTLALHYKRMGYHVSRDGDTLQLRFSLDSQSPSVLVCGVMSDTPLTKNEVAEYFHRFEKMALKTGCHQYRLVCPAGFGEGCEAFRDFNLALSGRQYIKDIHQPGYLDLFAHNEKMCDNIRMAFEVSDRVAAVQATGSGKSLLIAKNIRENAGKRQLVVAPRTNIHQEISRYIPTNVPVDYVTFHKLAALEREGRLAALKYDRIYIDEFHHGGAEKWGSALKKLVEQNSGAKVLGTTATNVHVSAAYGKRDMADELFDTVAGRMDLPQALVRHILHTPDYVCMPASYDQLRQDILSRPELRDNTEKTDRVNHLVNTWERDFPLHEIIRRHLPSQNCRIIVFCSDQKQLAQDKKTVKTLLEKAGLSYKSYDYFHSDDKKTLEGLDKFKKEHTRKRLQVIFCIDMLNEGVHVDGVQAAFFMRPTESSTLYHQQLGRIMSAGSSDCTVVFDMVDNIYARGLTDLQEGVAACAAEKVARLSTEGRPYVDPEPVTFRVDDYVKAFREQKEGLVPTRTREQWEDHLQRIADTYGTNGKIEIPSYTLSSRKDAEWFDIQKLRLLEGRLKPEQAEAMNRLKFDPYQSPEQKRSAQMDSLCKHLRMHFGDIDRLKSADLMFFRRMERALYRNELPLTDFQRLIQAGALFQVSRMPEVYRVAKRYALSDELAVIAKINELNARKNDPTNGRRGRPPKSSEEKEQTRLRGRLKEREVGSGYVMDGVKHIFRGTVSKEEFMKLKALKEKMGNPLRITLTVTVSAGRSRPRR